jgi:hypothetical protein
MMRFTVNFRRERKEPWGPARVCLLLFFFFSPPFGQSFGERRDHKYVASDKNRNGNGKETRPWLLAGTLLCSVPFYCNNTATVTFLSACIDFFHCGCPPFFAERNTRSTTSHLDRPVQRARILQRATTTPAPGSELRSGKGRQV